MVQPPHFLRNDLARSVLMKHLAKQFTFDFMMTDQHLEQLEHLDHAEHLLRELTAMKAAFELGYRLCEKGLNIQAAFLQFEKVLNGTGDALNTTEPK